jgi:hypothetical protein
MSHQCRESCFIPVISYHLSGQYYPINGQLGIAITDPSVA